MRKIYTTAGRLARRAVRLCYPGWTCSGWEELPQSAVFVVHHQNLAGPIRAMALLPREVRLWVLAPFCDRTACFRQYYGYTFTQRFGWPKAAAWPVARLCAAVLPGFLRQFQVIPVWRGSLKIRDTLRESNDALLRGQSILLCPDQDYAGNGPEVGALYDGFLHLERPYFNATGQHLPFVPLYCSRANKQLMAGTPVAFSGDRPFREEKEGLAHRLQAEMNRMGRAAGDVK